MENELDLNAMPEIAEEVVNININVNSHSSIQVNDMFFDPYNIENDKTKAKYIFLTHTHYDHLSESDIDKVINEETIIIATEDAKAKLEKYSNEKIFVKPNEHYELSDVSFDTIASYNTNKDFHKKEYNWVGYKIVKNGVSFVIPGDTDATEELASTSCDILFVPIGGTYTMTATEAAELTNKVKPQLVIPVHYGSIVGTKEDAETFSSLINEEIACKTFF